MTEQEILDGNKLIAEFMGCNQCMYIIPFTTEPDDIWFDVYNHPEIRQDNHSMWKVKELKYHSSWDWVMPVWFKIQRWYIRQFGLLTSTFEMSSLGIIIQAKNSSAFKYACVFNFTQPSDNNNYILDEMWNAIVEFIKWYNKQEERK